MLARSESAVLMPNEQHHERRREIARRLKAARQLAGFSNVEELAAAIGTEGLSAGTLFNVEQQRRVVRFHGQPVVLRPHEAQAIARVCGLPDDWFDLDLRRLTAVPDSEADIIADRLQAQLADLAERLDRIENQLSAESRVFLERALRIIEAAGDDPEATSGPPT